MLEVQHLGTACLVVKIGLGLLAFLSTKRRIGQDNIKHRRRTLKQPTIYLLAGQGVTVPEVGPVNIVKNQVGQRDWVNKVFLLPRPSLSSDMAIQATA